MALAPLKDFLGKTVYPGDKVILLIKSRCYRGLTDAYLLEVVYTNPGPWGYEFLEPKHIDRYNRAPRSITPYRYREPQCVKIENQ